MNMVRLMNTHPDFTGLTRQLDAELNACYGRRQATYDRHNMWAWNSLCMEESLG